MSWITAAQLAATRFVSLDPAGGVVAARDGEGAVHPLLLADADTGAVLHRSYAAGGAHLFEDAAGNPAASLSAQSLAVQGEVLAQGGLNVRDWASLRNVPSAFPPQAHTHDWSQITGRPGDAYTRAEADARFALLGGVQAGTLTRTASGRVVSDTFSRADGPIGPAYEVLGDPAAWRVSGQRLRVGPDPEGLLTVAGRPVLTESVQVVRVRRVGQGGISLFAQYDAAARSGYELALQHDGNIVVYRQSAGAASRVVLWTANGGFNDQTTYEFKFHTGPGFQTVYRDGVLMATTTDGVYSSRAGEVAMASFDATGYAEVLEWTACRGDVVSVTGLTGQQSARAGGDRLRPGGATAWPLTRLEVFGDDGALVREYAGLVFGGDVFSAA